MNQAALVVLLTDFGSSDHFSGVLKGVIATIAPGIPIIDLSHEIPPGDVRRAALLLWQAEPYFPPGSVFLCVVDPGVGTSRRAIIVDNGDKRFVGPDNGLFTFILKPHSQARELTNPAFALPNPSATFHGRDLFAPASAYAALGVPGPDFGPVVQNMINLTKPRLEMDDSGRITGEVLYADHFGNLLTSLGKFEDSGTGLFIFKPWQPGVKEQTLSNKNLSVNLPDGRKLQLVKTFSQITPGQCAALIGSSGLLEIAANHKSAQQLLSLRRSDIITLEVS